MNWQGTIWTSKTIYVDIDTGEQITQFKAEGKNTEYLTIKITKHVRYNEHKTRGYITYTKQCRRNPQLKLFTN